nr:Nidogen and EGF calcium-binding domain containing protein [Haemonchus contortus]
MWVPWLAFLPLMAAAMRVDPERIAARLRIEAETSNDLDDLRSERGRRQLQPKEISIQVTAPLFSSRLFEFGKDAEDNEVPQALDVGKKVQLTNPVNFYGEDYNTLYVLSNGAIGFEPNARAYKAGLFPSGARMIAPFWNRNDLRKGGHVYYREVTKGRVLERGQSEIRYQYDRSVAVKSAVIVTWEKMQPLEGTSALPEENTNTFQAALFITDNGTYANFIYSNIGWTQGAEAGFNRGDNSEHYALPTSGTGNIMYLEEYGNTGIPGEWMFELGEKRVIRCKQGIKGDTCDEGEWGADCASCCHCGEGTCHPLTGECPKGCAECWLGSNCQTKKENCHARPSAQCAPNAISFTDYDRCGEPLQRCQCLSGFKGDGYKICHDIDECREQVCHKDAICTNTPGRYFCQCQEGFSGDGVTECVASFLFPSDSHQPLPKSKTSKVLWQLKSPMKLFGKTYDKITVTTSGLLSLTDVPKTFGDRLEHMHMTGVAPFFAPIDTSRGGHVTVAEVTDSDTLTRVTRSIQENYQEPTFQAKNVLIVTYMNVTDGRAQRGNTFQTLLIGGTNSKQEKMTFAQMLYKDMQWGEGAEAAIMTNDISSSVSLPGSGTQGIEQLTQLSNVGQPGVWLFRIDGPTIQPCPLEGQQPPYCQTKTRPTDRILPPRPPSQQSRSSISSQLPSTRFGSSPAVAISVEPPRIIQPELVTPPLAKHINAPSEAPVTSSPTLPERSSATPTRTTRPRPRYENTPHRPIVSLGERDFEELDPDVFEITFPPFVTVIPEMFTPKEKSKQLPDFTVQDTSSTTTSPPQISTSESTFPTFKLADSQDTLVTVSLDNSQPEPTIKNPASTSSTTSAVQETQAAVEAEGNSQKSNNIAEEAQRETTELQPTTEKAPESPSITKATTERITTSPTTTAPHIFVFTTIRTTTKTSPKRPQIVTAGTTTTPEPEDDPDAAASKMAIIIPSVIVVVWILLLIAIALFVCCRRRTSSAQLRPYGPVYSVQPTSYALKRNGKPVEGSYEDHLEKAARMSSEMSAYNQRFSYTGRY